MPTLPDLNKKKLIDREPTLSAQKILEAILKYDNVSLADFPSMADEKRRWIQEQYI